jgi:hypothetical protein
LYHKAPGRSRKKIDFTTTLIGHIFVFSKTETIKFGFLGEKQHDFFESVFLLSKGGKSYYFEAARPSRTSDMKEKEAAKF